MPLINRYIFDRTVVLAAHNDRDIIEHGTGMLLRLNDSFLVITAAHVIKDYCDDPATIQLITTDEPSNWRFAPEGGDFVGGGIDEALDVGFLRLREPNSQLLQNKAFLGFADLEFFPNELEHELAIIFGMPGEAHQEERPGVHSFASFTYLTRFPGTPDWATVGIRPLEMELGYEDTVSDAFTSRQNPSA